MMKTVGTFLCALLLGAAFRLPVSALSESDLASKAAVLMDADTGQVLFDKNMDAKVYPASTTKIMTCLLVSEMCAPDEVITVSQRAVDIAEFNSANIGLAPGEKLTVEEALYGLMLASANEAANALAEHAAGSQERFVELMNQKAWEIGARNTRFSNPHGLHSDGHYTTSHDLALITRAAMQNPTFMKYFGRDRYTMQPTNLQPNTRDFFNFQSMVVDDTGYYDPKVLGGKVGYTTEAQHTMSTVASENGRSLVAIVMHSTERTQKFTDTQKLLRYGFEEFHQISLPAELFETGPLPVGDTGEVTYSGARDFTALLRNGLNEEDIRVIRPENLSSPEEISNRFEVTLENDFSHLPDRLGYAAVMPELKIDGVVVPVEIHEPDTVTYAYPPQKPDEPEPSTTMVIVLVACGSIMLALGLVLLRYHALQRRRTERIYRHVAIKQRKETTSFT